MSSAENPHFSAPEIFKEPTLPSELADMFKQMAGEVLAMGLAHKEGRDIRSPRGKGLNFNFDQEGALKGVSVMTPRMPEGYNYEITFSPPEYESRRNGLDGSEARFYVQYVGADWQRTNNLKLIREVLQPGDIEINEFFRNMAANIKPDNPES